MSRYMRTTWNQNYKNRARKCKAKYTKENDTKNAGPEPKTIMQYCREYRQRKRVRTTQAAPDTPGSRTDVDFVADEMESEMKIDLLLIPLSCIQYL